MNLLNIERLADKKTDIKVCARLQTFYRRCWFKRRPQDNIEPEVEVH